MMRDFLGRGLLAPFRRDRKSDFASGEAEVLIQSAVEQILGTQASSDFAQGELPWRPEFGSLLFVLRHQRNDTALQELAKVYVADALARWEPRIQLKAVRVSRAPGSDNQLEIRLSYNIIQRNTANNQVILENIEQNFSV